MKTVCLLLMVLTASHTLAAPPAKAPPPLYVYCLEMGVPGVKQRSIPEQAKLLKEMGYDGISGLFLLDPKLDEYLRAIDEAGIKLHMLQLSLNVDPTKPAYDPRLPDAIRKLKGRAVTVSLTLTGLKAADPAGMDYAVKALRQLGDVAAEGDSRISIYQHVNCWSESLPFIIEVVKKVDHPRVGYNFNLCHWLKVDGEKDYRPLLTDNAAKLFCVTICGAQIGSAKWTDGLIQSLDRGNFDNPALLKLLDQIGYTGPVGLMCYGVPGDPRDHLARSLKTWKSWYGR